MTRYLSPEQVLFIHSRLIQETGGAHGVCDLAMLLSALGRSQATFENHDLYQDIFQKAAALMDSLVRNHPFLGGNKRTAIAAAGIFLWMNGYRLKVKNEDMAEFTLRCAKEQVRIEEIVNWLQRNSVKA